MLIYSVTYFSRKECTMTKKPMLLCLVALLAVAAIVSAESSEGTWTGEVMDMACYVAQGAHGPDHAGCAKSCVKNGQPMGLLTDDGTLVLLAADHKDGAPYESLKDLAGSQAEVTGTLAERDGVRVVTVTGSKPAD